MNSGGPSTPGAYLRVDEGRHLGRGGLTLAWFPGHGSAFGTGLWLRADSNWYTSIAQHGYGADPDHMPGVLPGTRP